MEHNLNYQRVAQAIAYLHQNFKAQPTLDEVAEQVCLSPFHFQRLFTEWAGVSPKKFLQYVSLRHAQCVLDNHRTATLFDAAYDTGLSGTSRLHDLFVNIEGMTPGEYQKGGEHLTIRYSFADTPLALSWLLQPPKAFATWICRRPVTYLGRITAAFS